jgi:pyruvate formate lyase activating enzyme
VDKYTHKTLTGVDNSLILKNLQLLKDLNKEVIIRIPLITNLNDSIENIQNSINIAKDNNINEIHLLPYHTLGLDKYRRLQKNYNLDHIDKPIPEYLNKLKTLIEESKIKCIIGG